jgi:molecular chaperone GrpE
MVERKLWKELGGLGVSRIDQTGVPFDPNQHEAVITAAAPNADADHTVGAILQAGYRFGKTLLRPARVQVLTWSGDDAEGAAH